MSLLPLDLPSRGDREQYLFPLAIEFSLTLVDLTITITNMWSTADATSTIASAFTATGGILTATISVVVLGLVALLGLGFAVRHIKKYITGRKF